MVPAKLKDLVRGFGQRGSSALTFGHVAERQQPGTDLPSRHQELSALNTVTTAVNASVNLDEVLEKSLLAVLQFTGMEACYIRLLEGNPPKLTLKTHRGIPPAFVEKLRSGGTRPGGKAEQVLATKRSLVIKTTSTSNSNDRAQVLSQGFNTAAWIPIISHEQVIGIINVATWETKSFSPDQIDLLESIGISIGMAVEKAQFITEADRRRKHAEALREIGLSLTATHDPQQVLERIAEETRQLTGALFTFVVTPSKPYYRFAAIAGDDQGYHEVLKLSDDPDSPYGQGPLGRSVRSREPVICEDVLTDPLFAPWRDIASARGIRSLVAVPLLVQAQPVGSFLTYAPIPRAYDDETISLLSSLAAQAAAALENARLFQETERRAREQAVLNTLAEAVSESLETEKLLKIALEKVLTAMGKEVGYIRLLGRNRDNLHLVSYSGVSDNFINPYRTDRPPRGKAGQVLASGAPSVFNNMQADEIRKDTRAEGITAMAFIPLMARGRALGLLNLATREQKPFETGEIEFLSSIGEVIGVAVENARLFEEIKRKSQELESLVKINKDVASLLDREILLPRIAEEARKILNVDSSVFRLVEGEHLAIKSTSDPEGLKLRLKLRLDESVSGKITRENRAIAVKNVSDDPMIIGEHREILRKAGYRSFLGIPLRMRDQVIGTLNFYSKREREFQPEEINTISAFADQAAIAIANADLYHESRRQQEVQKLLKELSQDITCLEINSLAKKLTEKIREFFKVDISDIMHMEGNTWRAIGVSGIEAGQFLIHSKRILGRGRSTWIVKNRKPLLISDISEETDVSGGESLQKAGIRGYAGVPLFAKSGEVVGILRALTYQPREFTQEEVDLLQQLANGAAVALENARLFEETEHRMQEQAALNAIATATAQSLRFDELLQAALGKVLEVTGRNRGYIRLKDHVTGDLTLAAHRGISKEYAKTLLYERTGGGKSDQVFTSGQPLVVNDLQGTLLKGATRREGLLSIAWIPLRARGKVIGILNASTTQPVPFEDREVEMLQAIGNVIGVAVENARLFEETKLNEEYLRRTRDHLENIFNSLDREMFWSSDPNSNALLYVSQGTENIYGISREAFSTSPAFWKQVVHPEDLSTVQEIETEIKFGNKVKKEYRIIRPKTGEVRWVQTRIIPVLDERGKVVRTDGLLIDVTENKQSEEALALKAEELARSNTELQHFAYIASHDLQEPLRMVAGYTQLLAKRYKDKLDSDAQEFIDFAVDGVSRMQGLINALLAYSRIGTKGKEFEPTDLNPVLDYTLTNLRAAIQESGAVITHDPLPTVMADSTQIGQLLQNLIGNAIKFHGPEAPRIHLSSQQKDHEWLFSLKDNGIGIDPQYAERIFVIFQRLHTKQEYPGTGIGLALCKKIVERHGGRIWMESQPGEGTTFYFTMPK